MQNHKNLIRNVSTSHKQWPLIPESRFTSPRSDAELIAVVSATTGSRVDCCEAVFGLCARYWRIDTPVEGAFSPFGAKIISDMFGIRHITMIGGYVPLNWDLTDELFCAYVFPDARGWSDYVIYFTVAPGDAHASPRPGSIPSGTLTQFTLCHPHGYEWHTGRGIHAPTF